MGAIGKAFNAIGHGIGDAFKAVGHVAEGIVKLDFGKAAGGLKEMLGAGLDVARNAANLSPAGFAANALMGGKLDQLMKWADKEIESVAGGVIDKVANDMQSVRNGLATTVSGLATGNLSKVAQGALTATAGAAATASDFTAAGAANNLKMAALNTVVGGP